MSTNNTCSHKCSHIIYFSIVTTICIYVCTLLWLQRNFFCSAALALQNIEKILIGSTLTTLESFLLKPLLLGVVSGISIIIITHKFYEKNIYKYIIDRTITHVKTNRTQSILIFISIFITLSYLYFYRVFGNISFEQILFHAMLDIKTKVQINYIIDISITVIPLAFMSTFAIYILLSYINIKHINIYLVIIAILILFFPIIINHTFIYSYLYPPKDDFYENNYKRINPNDVTFNTKQNLIVITLESIESTFANKKLFPDNLIKNLTKLRDTHQSIYDNFQSYGTSWTIGGIVALQCGIPLRAIIENTADIYCSFLPRAISITDILAAHGYQQKFYQSAAFSFAGKDNFLKSHSLTNSDLYDSETLLKKFPQLLNNEKKHNWGFQDRVIYQQAKEELKQLSQAKNPFALYLLTTDTHFPEGFPDSKYPVKIEKNIFPQKNLSMATAITQADCLAAEFINWIQNQEFSKNTTIFVVNDHYMMKCNFSKKLEENPCMRRNLNILINPVKDIPNTQRKITHMDWAPTLLESIGAQLPEHRLGLGVSLYSDKKTLIEEYGEENLNNKLEIFSPFYINNLSK